MIMMTMIIIIIVIIIQFLWCARLRLRRWLRLQYAIVEKKIIPWGRLNLKVVTNSYKVKHFKTVHDKYRICWKGASWVGAWKWWWFLFVSLLSSGSKEAWFAFRETLTGGLARRYLHSSPMYWMTVTWCLLQSSQKLLAENLRLKTMVLPVHGS